MEQKKKTDRRTLYTKRVIREAFLNALRKKNYDKITVSELCEAAEINRSTFYLHYETVFSVFDELLDELLNEILSSGDKLITDASLQELFHFGDLARQQTMKNPDQALLLSKGFTYPRFIEHFSETTARKFMPLLKGAPELSDDQRFEVVKALIYANAMLNKAYVENHYSKDITSYNGLINRYILQPALENLK